MHDDDWTFTSMDAKIGSPTCHTSGLKSIQWSYNIHTYLSVIASNDPCCNLFRKIIHNLGVWAELLVLQIVSHTGNYQESFV